MNWRKLDNYPMDERSLGEILDGGQSFLWDFSEDENVWIGSIGSKVYRIRVSIDSKIEYKTSDPDEMGSRDAIMSYFGDPHLFMRIKEAFPWRSDPVLEKAMQLFPNLVILNQNPELVILSFLCSSNKRIVQIKEMIRLLSKNYGIALESNVYQAPAFDILANLSVEILKECKLGYRAKYILAVSREVSAKADFHESIRHMTYLEAKAELMKLSGIGPKVADCILLFAYQKLEAFPIDTWIMKILENNYRLSGYTPNQLSQFATAHFGKYAGYAQQFLFSYARSM